VQGQLRHDKTVAAQLREPLECSREILETSFIRKSSHLVCELFLSLSRVVFRISLEYAAAEVSCLGHEGFYDTFSLFTSKLPHEVFSKARTAES
jgi:hypothetical protein